MRRKPKAHILQQGRHYRLGTIGEHGAIWRKRFGRWWVVSRYPLTEDAWKVAQESFASWEPVSSPISETTLSKRGWHNLRKPWLIGALCAVVVLGAGGIYLGTAKGHSGSPVAARTGAVPNSTVPPVGTGWLSKGNGYVIFIEWNDNGGAVSGSAQVLEVSGTPPGLKPNSSTIEVTGSLTNSTVTLSFNGDVSVFGQFSGGGFTIDFPQPDGTLAPLTFSAASAAAYNLAVNDLDKQVASTNQATAAEDALRQQEQAVANDAARVTSDINGFSQPETSLGGDVKSIQPALQQEATDLATTQSKAQAVAAEAQPAPNNGQVCDDAGTVWDDAGTVWDDAGTVADDAGTVENDLSSLRNVISGLQSDFAQLASDEGKLPTYQPPNPPTQAEVSQAIGTANAGISAALATTNGDINQANAEVATAYQYTAQAYQSGNCGAPPSPPSPQQEIS